MPTVRVVREGVRMVERGGRQKEEMEGKKKSKTSSAACPSDTTGVYPSTICGSVDDGDGVPPAPCTAL